MVWMVWTHLHSVHGQGVLESRVAKRTNRFRAQPFSSLHQRRIDPVPPGPMVRRGGRGQRTHAPRGPALSSVPREESLSAVQCAHGGTSHKVRRPLLGPFRDLHLLSTTGLHAGDRTPPPPCGAVPSGQHEPQEPQDLARQGGAPGYVRPAAE